MTLVYEAIDHQGRRKSATLDTSDKHEAVAQLRREGLFVTRIEEASSSIAKADDGSASKDRLPLSVLVLFTRQMTMLLRAGSSVVPAVQAIQRQMKKPSHAHLLEKITGDLEEGTTLTEALSKHPDTFDAVYCAIISAGEASASLPQMFERLGAMVTKKRALRNKLIGAMAYPALLIVMSGSIMLTLMFFVIPRFYDMFTQLGVDPPASTKMLLAVGNLLAQHWAAVLVITIAAVGGSAFALHRPRGRQWLSDVQLLPPLFGRLRSKLIQAQVFRTLGTLMESRVGILDALSLIRRSTQNRRFRRLYDAVDEAVTSGGNPSTAFEESGLIDAYICQAIRTGEESGSIGEAMTYSADMLDETNEELINTTMKLIEPIILIIMGSVVGTVAVSLFLPLFDMTSAMR